MDSRCSGNRPKRSMRKFKAGSVVNYGESGPENPHPRLSRLFYTFAALLVARMPPSHRERWRLHRLRSAAGSGAALLLQQGYRLRCAARKETSEAFSPVPLKKATAFQRNKETSLLVARMPPSQRERWRLHGAASAAGIPTSHCCWQRHKETSKK